MNLRLYIGNLPFSTTDEELMQAFSAAGEVKSAKVILDRDTGRSRGFGFVEMATPEAAQAAIQMFHEKDFGGRPLVVNEARPERNQNNNGE
ncbi:RNA-binding protein [candidate division WWE3 bacterium]|nr:RNA-binding protein [candidate division WWE3 bacterium]